MGGGPGHMRHPHDLHFVKNGEKLVELFGSIKKSIESISTTPNVKIDGINVSFKYVNGEFAVDRGSLKEIDLSGITFDRIGERFAEGHGMRKAITTLLSILNEAEPRIRQEVKALGLENTTYFLNTEYVTGTTNAVGYAEDFIAIHGVNVFYEKVSRKATRPGIPRPIDEKTGKPIKDKSVEVPYDKAAMASLVQKLKPIGKKYNYAIYGPIPTQSKNIKIDYRKSLSTPININLSQETLDQNPDLSKYLNKNLAQLLELIDNKPGQYPDYPMIPMLDGTKKNPYHKETYLKIIEQGIPVDSLASVDHLENFIKGAVYMHASRLLGNDVLVTLTSDIGDMISDDGSHEGVVIRDAKFSPYPFKLTGEFIKTGMHGAISKKMAKEIRPISESFLRKAIRESIQKIIF